MNSAAKTGDLIGWIAIDRKTQPTTGIHTPQNGLASGELQPGNAATRIFTSDGRLLPSNAALRPGLYILTDGQRSRKLMVK